MKNINHDKDSKNHESNGPRYWRSLDEMVDKPEFKQWLHREFPEGASEADGVNRRHFLRIMAASFAVAGVGAAGCRRPEQYIMPYSKMPENSIPGIPYYYATSYPNGKDNIPVVVETHTNRPTHVEGNKDFAPYGGAVQTAVSASVLNLYDPDRLSGSYEGKKKLSREAVKDLIAGLSAKYAPTKGQGLAVLAEPSTSPSRLRLKKALLKKFPRMVWAEYSPTESNNPELATTQLFGQPMRAVHELKTAKRILAIDSDFLHSEAGSLKMSRDFMAGRKVQNKADAKKMNRLYSVESNFSLTGGMADHRLRVDSSSMAAFTAALTAEVMDLLGADSMLTQFLRVRGESFQSDIEWIRECANDLVAHKGYASVIAGSHLSVEVQQLVVYLNELLGSLGKNVKYLEVPKNDAIGIEDLAGNIEDGSIDSLVIFGGNPVYNAPADLNWKKLQQSVSQVIRYSYYFDETALEANVNIGATHYLEAWDDGRTFDGTYVPVQPMIMPLFDCFQELEVLARLSGEAIVDPYALVLDTFKKDVYKAATDNDFQKLLSQGFLPESGFDSKSKSVSVTKLKDLLALSQFERSELGPDNLEIRLISDPSVGDGFNNNNGWLQECPDPITKLTWDNAIIISPVLADELGFDTKEGEFLIGGVAKKTANFKRGREVAQMGELTLDGVSIKAPLHILPGLADWTVILPLGYGRKKVGRVGEGSGFDFYPFTHSEAGLTRTGAKIQILEETYNLANTQEHWSMEGRAILRENSASKHAKNSNWVNEMGMESHSPPIYGKDKKMSLAEKSLKTPRGGSAYETPDFGKPPPNVDVWKEEEAQKKFIPEQQWGMAIDLNVCTGCNSCVVACQSENNIPIVGKDQVMRGREMHWIRLDRYYSSGVADENMHSLPSDPQVSMMPVGCLHCEMAPCEQVCPVNATVHDRQGLNVMAYNRCVGTRYCANNCPYKVRRFNFFDYNKRNADEFYMGPVGENRYKTEGGELHSMQKNPDVTVRMRGVMEKCTYCVQRIEQGKIAQRVKAKDSDNIHVPDGIIRTACQNACPTEAITFGDISDTNTEVYKTKMNDRNYSLLGYLNTRPRTTYLARLRNPNPKMPDYEKIATPFSYREYKDAQPGSGQGDHGENDNHGHDDH